MWPCSESVLATGGAGFIGSHLVPDWILLNDADEFLEPPDGRESLCKAISREDAYGFNVVQFDNFEFRLTEMDRTSQETDVGKKPISARGVTTFDTRHGNATMEQQIERMLDTIQLSPLASELE